MTLASTLGQTEKRKKKIFVTKINRPQCGGQKTAKIVIAPIGINFEGNSFVCTE